MFGFLRPHKQDIFYRSVYSRCCQHQRNFFGLLSLPLLNYDAIFVYLLFIDSGVVDISHVSKRRCCRLHRDAGLKQAHDSHIGRFCAAFSMLLAETKLADDIRDERAASSWLLRSALRNKLAVMHSYFLSLDSRFNEKISDFLAAHLDLENIGKANCLTDYANPTGKSFGYCFSLASALAGEKLDKRVLFVLGEKIGKSIIFFDCAADWATDLARGCYNPIRDETDRQRAISLCKLQIGDAYKICESLFTADSATARALASVYRRAVGAEQVLLGRYEYGIASREDGRPII